VTTSKTVNERLDIEYALQEIVPGMDRLKLMALADYVEKIAEDEYNDGFLRGNLEGRSAQ
jgi:hypothetical protein